MSIDTGSTRNQGFVRIYFHLLYTIKRVSLVVLGALLILASFLMLLGVLLIFTGSQDWKTTQGTIKTLKLKPTGNRRKPFKVELQFAFTHVGQDYVGDLISPYVTDNKVSKEEAQRLQEEYRVNGRAEVFFNPKDPSQCFLAKPNLLSEGIAPPIAYFAMGCWMIWLFIRTIPRRVPAPIGNQLQERQARREDWKGVFEQVVDHDNVIAYGTIAYSGVGGLLVGWPDCRVALIASPHGFYVLPGPLTKRGLVTTLVMICLECLLMRWWIPITHGVIVLMDLFTRSRDWTLLRNHEFGRLEEVSSNLDQMPIENATIYGFDPKKRRLWFRLHEKRIDDHIVIKSSDVEQVEHLIGFVMLMQASYQKSDPQ